MTVVLTCAFSTRSAASSVRRCRDVAANESRMCSAMLPTDAGPFEYRNCTMASRRLLANAFSTRSDATSRVFSADMGTLFANSNELANSQLEWNINSMFAILRCIGGSSNGRTTAFEAVYLGSSPSPPASRKS